MKPVRPRITLALYNGRIYAGKSLDRVEEAVGLSGNKISILETSKKVISLCNPSTRKVDLVNRAVIPAFADSHTHFIQMGVNRLHLDLSSERSLGSFLTSVKKRCRSKRKGEWVLGSGWDESRWPEKRYPTLHEIDVVSPQNPVWLRRVDGHMGVANSLSLQALQIRRSTRGFEVNRRGKPNGILREEAAETVESRLQPDEKVMLKGFRVAVRTAYRLGVTSIHDMAEPEHIGIYRRLATRDELGVRVYLNFYRSSLKDVIDSGQRSGEGDAYFRMGALKLFADGSLGARTAALWDAYTDAPGEKGMLIHPQGELVRLVRLADSHGLQLAIHCIGERGIDAALTALEQGCNSETLQKRRHRLEHFELVDKRAVERAKRLRLTLSMQPNYVDEWSRPGGMYNRRLGRKRLRINNPFRKLLRAGLPIAFGSDCMPFSPLYGVYSAVNAPFDSQKLTVREAIACYTKGSAYASFEEKTKGTIEVGELADLVVLSADPFENPDRLAKIKVDMTIFDGKIVYLRRDTVKASRSFTWT